MKLPYKTRLATQGIKGYKYPVVIVILHIGAYFSHVDVFQAAYIHLNLLMIYVTFDHAIFPYFSDRSMFLGIAYMKQADHSYTS